MFFQNPETGPEKVIYVGLAYIYNPPTPTALGMEVVF